MNNDKLNIAEIYVSVQGEGPCIGVPAIFLRLAGCNFDCTWQVNGKVQHCDTRWAKKSGKSMSINEVLLEIFSLREKYKVSTLIVTGGEPALQAEPLMRVLQVLRNENNHFYHIDIESNGTMPKHCTKDLSKLTTWLRLFDHYVVSPKPQTKLYDLSIFYKESDKTKFFLKFVYDETPESLPWIIGTILWVQSYCGLTPENIILMSAGVNAKELRERDKRTIEICKEHNWRFSPRVHSYIWGLKKGV